MALMIKDVLLEVLIYVLHLCLMIHLTFDLILVYSAYGLFLLSQHHLLKTLSFLYCVSPTPLSKISCSYLFTCLYMSVSLLCFTDPFV